MIDEDGDHVSLLSSLGEVAQGKEDVLDAPVEVGAYRYEAQDGE